MMRQKCTKYSLLSPCAKMRTKCTMRVGWGVIGRWSRDGRVIKFTLKACNNYTKKVKSQKTDTGL